MPPGECATETAGDLQDLAWGCQGILDVTRRVRSQSAGIQRQEPHKSFFETLIGWPRPIHRLIEIRPPIGDDVIQRRDAFVACLAQVDLDDTKLFALGVCAL